MKTNIFSTVLLGLALTFASCEQTNVEPATATEAELVEFAAVATSVTANVSSVYSEAPTTPATSTTPATGKKGCKVTGTDVANLPAAVTSYINTNYAGATINRAGTTANNNTIVHITLTDATRMLVVFDAAGNFVKAGTHEQHKGTEVAAADLPATVTAYITTTYTGATIKRAAKNPEGKFIVVITKADASITGLAFNADGTFANELTLKGDFKGPKGGKGGKKRRK